MAGIPADSRGWGCVMGNVGDLAQGVSTMARKAISLGSALS